MSSQTDRSFKKPIPILFENEQCMVFNKPAGILVIPSPKKETNTLVNIVNHQYAQEGSWNLHPCHRLDRETSGVIIFAKGKKHQQAMMDLFQAQKVKKTYIAFVYGKLKKREGVIDKPIANSSHRKYNKKDQKQKSAITQYKVLQLKKEFTVVEVKPQTGRTNQIRIHMRDIGHPLVGDRKFGFVRDYSIKFKRTALHAQKLIWKDLYSSQTINVQSNLPNDMEVFLGSN